MTNKKVVTDEQLGHPARRQRDLFTRVEKGVVGLMSGLQNLAEGKSSPVTETDYLHFISPLAGLILPATSGKRIISDAKDVFPGHIDRDFKRQNANESGKAKPKTVVDVYEMKKDGNLQELFGSLGKAQGQLLTHDQIITFSEIHKDWLHPKGYSTFFVFQSYGKFFVADVYCGPILLKVCVYRFDDSGSFVGGHHSRLVVPRLADAQQLFL